MKDTKMLNTHSSSGETTRTADRRKLHPQLRRKEAVTNTKHFAPPGPLGFGGRPLGMPASDTSTRLRFMAQACLSTGSVGLCEDIHGISLFCRLRWAGCFDP